jgi:uncharacterized protein YlxP (DUF503 family)
MLVVGCSWDLSLPECRSLKDKRRVVKSLKDRIRGRFNVSVAETAYQEVWTRVQLSVVLVTADGASTDSVLDKLDHFIEGEHRVVILSARKARY